MQDFPLFTTEYGVASLTLKEIPYRQEAYIRIQDVQPGQLKPLVKECRDFCRAAGAEKICIRDWPGLEDLSLHTSVLEMRGTAWADPQKLACLFPVTESTVACWRQFYNQRMAGVDNAATLEARDEQRILDSGGAYFVHDSGRLLGIGWMEDVKLLAVAAQPGEGERVMHSLMSLVEGAQMVLEVASTNTRAIQLYSRLGFLNTRQVSQWYSLPLRG